MWTVWTAHPVLEVGEIRIPSQRDHVHVDHPVLGRQEQEVNELSCWPHAPVCLGTASQQR